MKLSDILNEGCSNPDCKCEKCSGEGTCDCMVTEDCLFEEVYVDDDDNILTEAAMRQFKLTNKRITRKYRCMAGPKKGRLVSKPSGCATRKDPAKVRHGRKVMRSKKGVIARKSKISKKKAMNKIVAKMNRRLMGKPA